MAKSTTFETHDIDLEQVSEDLIALTVITSEQLTALNDFWSHGTIFQKDEISNLEGFLRESELAAANYKKLQRLISFCIGCSQKYDDRLEDLFDDLVEIEVEGLNPEGIREFLESNKLTIESEIYDAIKGSVVSYGIPQARSVGFVCDARMVPEHRFRALIDSAETYSPKARGWEPVAIVTIGTSNDEQHVFQANDLLLSRLIEALSAARKEIAYVKNRLQTLTN